LLKQLGVDQAIDYSKTKFEDVVKDVDVVLDATRSDALQRSYGIVKKSGFIVTITGRPDPAELQKHGIQGDSMMAHPDAHVLEQLTQLIEEKKLNPMVSQTFPLADAGKAHQQIETQHTRGKIVLKVAEETVKE
jgi:NADPH:quinone reductase-like Zn-dependent oxidoreductase